MMRVGSDRWKAAKFGAEAVVDETGQPRATG